MIEHWIGPAAFQRGVREYIHAHAFENATSQDLLGALDRASGRDVSGTAATFLDRPGVPVVAVRSSCAAGKLTVDLAQSAWHPLGVASKPTDDAPWRIPVCVSQGPARDGAPGAARSAPDDCTDLKGLHGSIEAIAAACPETPYPNAAQAGYYRHSLSEGDVRALARDPARLDVPSRIGFVANLLAQERAGALGADVLLGALPAFDKETDRHVVQQLIDALYDVGHELVDDATRPAFRAYVAARMKEQKARLGGQAKPGEADDRALLRPAVLLTLGEVARDPATLREAEALTESWLEGSERTSTPTPPPCAVRIRVDRGGAGAGRSSSAPWQRGEGPATEERGPRRSARPLRRSGDPRARVRRRPHGRRTHAGPPLHLRQEQPGDDDLR